MRQHSGKKRLGAVLLSLALCLSLLPTAALAAEEGVEYIEYSWDENTQALSSTEGTKSSSEYTEITNTNPPTTWGSNDNQEHWYVVSSDTTIGQRVTVTGDVHLILQNDCTLTVNGGINVAEGNSLTIYGQTVGETAGTLVAQNCTFHYAGIGGGSDGDGGTVTIHGGNVTATGGTGGAGIGGGNSGDGGDITIYGGTIEASSKNGAGIGGGTGGNGDDITIYGGTVTATSSYNGAGIGGGNGGDGGTVNIYGGTVEATSNLNGAGIGGGSMGAGGEITISGGTVTATSSYSGAGIGKGHGFQAETGNFSTGDDGNAVIFASGGINGAAISDQSGKESWSGVIFQGNEGGKLYGNTVTPTEDFTIPAGKTLTIDNDKTLVIQGGVTLTISEGATVTNNGTITNNGAIDIYGNGKLDDNGTVNGTGKVNYKVTSVTLDKTELSLTVGDSATLNATVEPEGATNRNVTWTSSDETVVTVDANGKVTAVGAGEATITATAADGSGEFATCEVTVTQTPVTGVTLDKTSLTLTEGETGNLIATVQPENATNKNVTWESSDTSVATVENGVVTAVGAGTATITATAADGSGKTATCTVTVEQPYTPPPANPNYRIDLTTTEGGTVDKDPSAAKAGETVTLTATPDEGYEVGEITVTDRFGDTVEVTENADGTYTFTMPNGQVKVAVTFVEATPEPLPFTDVNEGDWFHDAVRYAYDNGLMDGVGDGQFAPNATTNRVMVVTILYRLAGEPDVSGDVGFTDVAAGQWYTDAIAWAAQKGIVNGISDMEFAPSGDLTREQLATILYRYAEAEGYDVSAAADLSGYPDAGKVQTYAQEAMSWAVAEGIVEGMDGNLNPAGNATRAQIATILMRFCEGVAQ